MFFVDVKRVSKLDVCTMSSRAQQALGKGGALLAANANVEELARGEWLRTSL